MIGTPNRAQAWLNFAQRSRDEGGLGLAPHQAAGLVGNLVHESGQDLNPWGPSGDNGTAWGTAQWRGDRLARLKALPNYQSMEAQQQHMRNEMDSSEAKAYAALQKAQSPEEAARIFDQLYERSDGATRSKREAAARSFMDQFGGGGAPDTGGALSFASTSNTGSKMAGPALSPEEMQGPGALSQGYGGSANVIGQALTNMGASLAGISNADQAKALVAQAAGMQKAPADRGTWSIQTDPNGNSGYFNNKTGQWISRGNVGKANEKEDEAEKLAARSARDQFEASVKAGAEARGHRGLITEARQLVEDPVVAGYQGPVAGRMVDIYSALGTAGEDKAQRLQAIGKERELQLSALMKGAVSDYERRLQAQASGFGITQSVESNKRALAAQERLIDLQEAKADYYQKVGGGKPIGDKWAALERDFIKQWEADHPLTAGSPAAAPKGERPALGDIFKSK